jgi:hypothetical protein
MARFGDSHRWHHVLGPFDPDLPACLDFSPLAYYKLTEDTATISHSRRKSAPRTCSLQTKQLTAKARWLIETFDANKLCAYWFALLADISFRWNFKLKGCNFLIFMIDDFYWIASE